MRHPQNETLAAIYVTTLAMYVLYHVPCRGAAVLLAGMRSILNSDVSLCVTIFPSFCLLYDG